MVRRGLAVVAATGVALLSLAPVASADPGGTQNTNACHGHVISTLASNGITPVDIAKGTDFYANAGSFNKDIKALCAYVYL